eukprot:CAMPEP_0115238544 /NCGR_PEP_ID=MMETSP0270-20121206/36937_1 /TAXON_ID=71861 /ORGANISM="Scrippsiella trochoidea, Strain CCMP3099" /LENGTH=90 /DNA_ID=CAMNT_0002653473 /DNA_START=448 /DNA_END=720 /DNA_ORIENTATION=-
MTTLIVQSSPSGQCTSSWLVAGGGVMTSCTKDNARFETLDVHITIQSGTKKSVHAHGTATFFAAAAAGIFFLWPVAAAPKWPISPGAACL